MIKLSDAERTKRLQQHEELVELSKFQANHEQVMKKEGLI
jgi:hypothetical protein